ncbi:Tc toxin subunit A-related protein [Actinokineospora bangkokensis]|uniref:Tc toxin complex TcA C-terminal TcB-binding domain-containing protein n=1 Tax=Actinokineospora bangkokensis TaxID=1193682 RepID=A0A1Q9LPD1_9PSEU|nr:hypothetical protein [Actinokineospora bangkokensis]OLR93853.1 hypothetical protein BJP25_16660 [Actinokineospora bangkokensis]
MSSDEIGFHTHAYREFLPRVGYRETKETKHFVVQERDLSYRVRPHFHPYAGELTQRLITGGVRALQDADTDHAPGGAVLPFSTEVAAATGTRLDLAAGVTVLLTATTTAATAGATVQLAAGYPAPLATGATAALTAGARLRLRDGFPGRAPGSPAFALPATATGELTQDTPVTLPGPVGVLLPDGVVATLPAATVVLVRTGTRLTTPAGTTVSLLAARPRPALHADLTSPADYDPSPLVRTPLPVADLDFAVDGAYSVYNWELFYHVPHTIAVHLSRSGWYAQAQQWFHVCFDPTATGEQPAPARFWGVRPFQEADVRRISDIMVNLSTGLDPDLRAQTLTALEAWRDTPFRPHVVARHRQQAYMFATVMAYLDNLIAWGDSLFAQDTGEAIDEALMLYVLAANILGPRPQEVPRRGSVRPQSYAGLRGDLDAFGNSLRELEADIPFDLMPTPTAGAPAPDGRVATLRGLGRTLYFCVPRNDKLLSYWDTVADRLFKIRNSLDLRGAFRQLALFDPPIDPALLARAAAAGLDVGAVVSGVNQPLSLVRFGYLVAKAAEVAQEVKALGANLLSALEKEDGEALALLRARHERIVVSQAEHVRYGQHQEAVRNREAVAKSLDKAMAAYVHHERLLGRKDDEITPPAWPAFDQAGFDAMTFTSTEPDLLPRPVAVDLAAAGAGTVGEVTFGLAGAADVTGGQLVNRHEAAALDGLETAQGMHDVAQLLNLIGKGMIVIPEFGVKFHFWGLGGDFSFGGPQLAEQASLGAEEVRAVADRVSYEATRADRIGGYANRERDWTFAGNDAAAEVSAIHKQLRAAELREAVAATELANHRTTIKQAQEVEFFLSGERDKDWTQALTPTARKKAGQDLYTWLQREVRGLHTRGFQFAFDLARKAERALQHELGDPGLTVLDHGYLEGREGLLAAERLLLDLKRMELAYHENNRREHELTKHVSLLAVDPVAVLRLRRTGRCSVRLPEELFDLDGPGHYFRRLRGVSVSVPCVAGPHTPVNLTLTLVRSSVRTDPAPRGGYARDGADDDRFSDSFGGVESVVTSTGRVDAGVFDTQPGQDRYAPFEHAGAIGEWQLQLPADPSRGEPRQFDYDTISDVVLHLRYTARDGGAALRAAATANLVAAIDSAAAGTTRLFSVKHEFPAEWAALRATPATGKRHRLRLDLRDEHYPFWTTGRLTALREVRLLAQAPGPALTVYDTEALGGPTKQDVLQRDPALGGLLTTRPVNTAPLATPVGRFTAYLEEVAELEDLWIAVTWAGRA